MSEPTGNVPTVRNSSQWNPLAAFGIGSALVGVAMVTAPLWSVWTLIIAAMAAAVAAAVWWLAVPAVRERRAAERRQRAAERRRRAALRDRADEQHRWTILGDIRGTYGVAGAEQMRAFSSPPRIESPQEIDETVDVARVAWTPAELTELLAERKPGWHWAAFGSVLVQRRAAVQDRLRDQQLCFAPPSGQRAETPEEAAALALDWAGDISVLAEQIEQVMLSTGFQAVFAPDFDEENADAATATHPAQRLMDLHDRALEIAEAVRGLAVPLQCRELFVDLGLLADVPLAGFDRFIDDYLARTEELPELATIIARRGLRGPIPTDPVMLTMDDSTELMERFFERLRPMLAD